MTLLDHLRREGHDDRHIVAAGLARESSNQNLIDVFRDRLVLPVTNNDDLTVVGFVGRVGPDGRPNTAKCLNSPSSDLSTKGRLLYGLGEEREALQQGVQPVLVEDPLDVLAIRAARQVQPVVPVAVCGTAFTADHAQVLAETIGGREIAVAFDPDAAGQAGMARAHDLLAPPACGTVRTAASQNIHCLPTSRWVFLPPGTHWMPGSRAPYAGQLVAAVVNRTSLDSDTVTAIAANLVSRADRADQRRDAPAVHPEIGVCPGRFGRLLSGGQNPNRSSDD